MASKSASESDRKLASVEAVIAEAGKESYTYRGKRYGVHPAAQLFPLLEGDRYRELLEHCKENGVLEPVRLLHGLIVDGRNRVSVAIEADLDLEFEELSPGIDPCRIVTGRNLMRRDLAPQQRSLIARSVRDLSEYYFKAMESRLATALAGEEKVDPVSGEVVAPAIGASDTPGLGAHDPLPVRPSAAPSGGPVAPKATKGGPKEQWFEPTPARGTAAPPAHSSGSADPRDDDEDSAGGLTFLAPMTTKAAAEFMGVHPRDVNRADQLVADVPDLVDAVKNGIVSIREALDPEVKAAPEEVRREALAEVLEEGGDVRLLTAVQRRQQERGVAPGPEKRKAAQPKGRKSGSAVGAGVTQIEELPDLTTSHRTGSGKLSPADDPATAYEVYSPTRLVMISRVVLGAIDLDPASSEEAQFNVEASKWYGRDDNGLSLPWKGRVYCFPPPSEVSGFADKLGQELMAGNTTSAVFVAPTESGSQWAQKLLARPELTMIVVMRGDEPLVMEPVEKGARPGVWRAPAGLTVYVFGVEAADDCCEKWAVWGCPFVLAAAARKAA